MADPNDPNAQGGSGEFPAQDQPATPQTSSVNAPKEQSKGGVSPDLKRSASMGVLNKTQKIVKSGASLAKSGVHQAAKRKDMTVLVVVVLVGCMVLGLVAVAWFVKPTQPTTTASNVSPSFQNEQSLTEEVRSWKGKTAREVNDLTSKVTNLETAIAGIDRRLSEQDKTLKDALSQLSADFNRAADQKLRLVEELAKSQQGPTAGEARTVSILEQFRRDLTSSQQSPAEAKARAAQLLRQAGYPEERIRDLLADVATKAGRISTGNVAEAPLSAAERATAPDWVRPLLDSLHDLVYGQALTAGLLYPEQIEGVVGDFLKANGGQAHLAEVTPVLTKAVTNLVRVRRENLTPDQEDALPLLVTLRDEGKVDRNDKAAIASLVWGAKERLPEGTTAGQLLTIAQAVARAIGPTTSQVQDAPFKLLDAEGERYASEVVTTAAFNAIQMGKTQSDQYAVADRALTNYLDTSRYQATQEQRRSIVLRSMSAAQQRAKGKTADLQVEAARPSAQPVSTPPPSSHEEAQFDDRFLYFGPLKVERGRAVRALGFVIPSLAKANALDPLTTTGATAVITGFEQLPRVVVGAIKDTAGKPMGGQVLMSTALPDLILQMRNGEILGRVPVKLSSDEQTDKGSAAQIMRGAVLGSIYGPFTQDGDKARAAANEILPQVETKSPLTTELKTKLEAVPPTTPYIAVLTAYEAFRPGRFGYPVERYQELVQRQEALLGQIGALRDLLAGQMKPEQIGVYEENLRLFIPLAIASHDEPSIAPADIMQLVKSDIWQYTTVFLAENKVGRFTMETVMPRYAASIANNDSGKEIIQRITEVMGQKVNEIFQPRAKEITPETIVPIATAIANEAIPVIESAVVQEAVISRVQPRIKNSASSPEKFAAAMVFARKRVGGLVTLPYTPARIDSWASTLTEEARRVLEGGATTLQPAPGSGPDAQANPGKGRTGLWPTPSMVTGVATGQLVGTSTTMVRTRKVEIPAISYADAHLLTGVDAEIGGRSNLPIVVNVNFAWQGPAQSRLVMRNCRLSGTASAMAGPERVAIDLKKLSFVFPSGRSIHAEVNGYVTDNEVGQYGAKGEYNWNIQKVLPLAMLSGGAEGAAEALKSSTNSTVVGITGATASVNTGDQLQQALAGGAAGGFGIMSEFFKSALTDVKPSVWLKNGKRISVMLLDPVEIDVPESEFSYITAAGNSGFAP